MIKELIAIANSLDEKGFTTEADALDNIIKSATDEFVITDMDQIPDDWDDTEKYNFSSYRDENPEQKLLTMIHASEEIARRLGLSGGSATMTADELRGKLVESLDLRNLSEDDIDKVLSLAARLVEDPISHIAATPRVRISD